MADNFELLIDLGVDTVTSRNNINKAIENLKNLDTVKVQLDVDGFNGVDTNFKDLQKRIKDLESEITSLNNVLKSTGSSTGVSRIGDDLDEATKKARNLDRTLDELGNGNSGKYLGSLDKEIISSFKSLEELYAYLDSKEIKFKISRNSLDEVTKVVTQVKNELGQLETLNIKPKYFDDSNEVRSLGVSSTTVDANTFGLNENIDKSLAKLKELSQQGLIVSQDLDKYLNSLNTATSNKQVDELTKEFTQLAKAISITDSNTVALQKFNNELDKLERKGSITSTQKQEFIDQANLVQSTKQLQILQTTLRGVANETSDLKTIDNVLASLTPTVDRLNSKLEVTSLKLGTSLDDSKLAEIRQEIERISNTKINTTDDIARLNAQIANTEKAITQLTVAGNNVARFDVSFNKAEEALKALERTGYASTDVLTNFKNQLANIPTGDLASVKNLLSQIKTEADKINDTKNIANELRIFSNELNKIESQLEKTKNLYANSFDPAQAKQAEAGIASLRAEYKRLLNLANEDITLITDRDRVQLRTFLTETNNQVRNFNAQATTAARNSTGFVDSLRTAFQKFPVWVLASTAFYGVIRGIKDITTNVIELDSAITNLRRVSDGSEFEFNGVIDRALVSVTNLSGKLPEFLDLLSEFARTGKTINESFDLAETTQQLVNISDLNADQAVNSLTAAMIAFNIEAQDSARIADKLNEVDNNYSITTLDLSQSLNKAASTAKTFGVTLDELVGLNNSPL